MNPYKQLDQKLDLSRWNRANLSQFRYIDGNAITYLEALRQALVEQYDENGVPQWQELLSRFPEAVNETAYQGNKRLNQQYYDERRDYAWEIVRAFARSLHVLGEYIDAYANEAYLPTSVEWDNVRKLVAMLGYQPSPPASAETHIALLFKPGESGEIKKGFAVKNKPKKGASTIVFETQDKLEGDAGVNQLHVKDWNKNLTRHNKVRQNTLNFYVTKDTADMINVGDNGILATESQGVAVHVLAVSHDQRRGSFVKLHCPRELQNFLLHNTTLYLQPDFVSSPLPHGENSATLNHAPALNEGEVLIARSSGNHTAERVVQAQYAQLSFQEGSTPQKGQIIYRAHAIKQQEVPGVTTNTYVLPKGVTAPLFDANLNRITENIKEKVFEGSSTLHYVSGAFGDSIYYAVGDSLAEIIAVGTPDINEVEFIGKPTAVATGKWCLVEHKNGQKAVYRIQKIQTGTEKFTLTIDNKVEEISVLHASFKLALKDINHDKNLEPIGSGLVSTTRIELEDTHASQLFKIGQKILCATDTCATTVSLQAIDERYLYVSPAIHQDIRFTCHNTVLYGNVVRATHGETQPEKIVGSGDASQISQQFLLDSEDIAWVADASFSAGVRADLVLRVGRRVWQQVQDLSVSAPEDYHYTVKVNEDNRLTVCFGDGRHGRRLPTGVDNIRVLFRDGYGEAGNLEANALVKIVQPHPLLDNFVAPLPTVGGAEKESTESMRVHAPATVLALSRAVSLNDFTHLAAHHSMVWQAKAFAKMPDRPAQQHIEVVVVAAGGETFHERSETATLIKNFLVSHAAPKVSLSVVSYQPVYLQLHVSVMVDHASYDQKLVEQDVQVHLETNLMLKNRTLGQALFRSEVIALLEQVEGVENSHCEILLGPYTDSTADEKPRVYQGDDGGIRKVEVRANQLLHLDSSRYSLQISTLEYEI